MTQTNIHQERSQGGSSLFCRENVGKGEPERIHIQMTGDVRTGLQKAFMQGGCDKWLREYEELAEWLKDNKGKGLLMYGNCGRGKTVFGGHILPATIYNYFRNKTGIGKYLTCVSYRDLNEKLATLKNCKLLYIDDLGQEEFAKIYGNTIHAFADLVDNAEKKGNLLIISTNLSLDQLHEKYGDRVISRLKALTKTVLFNGEDLRK